MNNGSIPTFLPARQLLVEHQRGHAIGYELWQHEDDLSGNLDVLEWSESCSPGSPFNVPVDLMVLPIFCMKQHSGTGFYRAPSQFFCRRFAQGRCPYGGACNKRHEPLAEVCCADWNCYGYCEDPECEFYHREPEGEALSFFNKPISYREYQAAIRLGRAVRYWPEQEIIWSGHWRAHGDDHTFKRYPPNYFVKCGLTCGTRATGIPWTNIKEQ